MSLTYLIDPRFVDNLPFRDANFKGSADFFHARFADVTFAGVSFALNAQFDRVKFNREADFSGIAGH